MNRAIGAWALAMMMLCGVALGADAAPVAKIVARAVDGEGKTLWSLQLHATLMSSEEAAESQGLRLADKASVSQTVELAAPATTRPVKWMGKRELTVSRLVLLDKSRIRLSLSCVEKTPYAAADQIEYAESGIDMTLLLEDGKEQIMGGTLEKQYLVKVTVEPASARP